jgi:hypothetical protein
MPIFGSSMILPDDWWTWPHDNCSLFAWNAAIKLAHPNTDSNDMRVVKHFWVILLLFLVTIGLFWAPPNEMRTGIRQLPWSQALLERLNSYRGEDTKRNFEHSN